MKNILTLSCSNLVILAGAGISIPSGIASGQMFNRLLIPQLTPEDLDENSVLKPLFASPLDHRDPRKGTLRFEQLVQILRDQVDPQLLIMNYLEASWQPTHLHYWLAAALRQGAIVLTTNLDSLIEVAYHELFGSELPQVIDLADYTNVLSTLQTGPALLKLHGSIRRQAYLKKHIFSRTTDNPTVPPSTDERAIETFAVTLDTIGQLDVTARGTAGQFLLPQPILDALTQILPGKDILVIGYSGSDDFDIKPSFERMKSIFHRTIWVEHREAPSPRTKTIGDFTLLRGRTDSILDSLLPLPLPQKSPPAVDTEARFRAFVEEWGKLAGLDNTRRHLVCGEILKSMGYVSNAISTWEIGLEGSLASNRALNAKIYLSLGNTYKLEGSYAQAQEIYELGMERCMQIGDMPGYLRAKLGYVETVLLDPSFLEEQPDQAGFQLIAGVIKEIHNLTSGSIPPAVRDLEKYLNTLDELTIESNLLLSRHMRMGKIVKGKDSLFVRTPLHLMNFFRDTKYLNLLEMNKNLYIDFLQEACLRSYEERLTEEFQVNEKRLAKLYELMSLPYKKAVYHLELACLIMAQEPGKAEAAFANARRQFTDIHHRVGAAYAGEGEAVLHLMKTRYALAEPLLRQALETYYDHNVSPRNLARVWQLLGNIAILNGQTKQADQYFKKSDRSLYDCQDLRIRKVLGIPVLSPLLPAWQQEFSRSAFEFIGMSGWATKTDLDPHAMESLWRE